MSLNISNHSATNDTIVELAINGKKETHSFASDMSFIFLVCLLAIVLASGIVGNASVLVIIKKNRTFQSAQNYLLANLAAANISGLTFCGFSVIPVVSVLPDGLVGSLLCKFFIGFNVPLTATVTSVFTLTVLAVERYNAVVKPLQMLKLTVKAVRYAIAATWAVSVGLNVPILVHTGYKFKKAFCHQTYSKEAELTHITFYVFSFLLYHSSSLLFAIVKLYAHFTTLAL